MNLTKLPIIRGRAPNAEAIASVEKVLADLKSGQLVNVALCAQRLVDGRVVMVMNTEAEDATKLRAGLATLGTMIDLQLIEQNKSG